MERLVGALKTKLGATYDDLVDRPTSFHGFDPGAPVKRHNNWRGTEQLEARKYISELLDIRNSGHRNPKLKAQILI